ncbi:hypothetical protein [Paraburkholderia phosphatilytica]|uniref:hypothetical protein n=1 Tax=Paraburkholderia phosphatilytica TaxID=2282883 RepID=UPI000E545A63|nr:hypothetical protein [Paraburkholderia phosphatilytica]
MKSLPWMGLAIAISAYATTASAAGMNVQSVGTSQQPPAAVAQCIAHKWADASQQQVVSQAVMANDAAVDVYMPGQQPPNGSAAMVRPARQGNGTWVGYRAGGAGGTDATSGISACL